MVGRAKLFVAGLLALALTSVDALSTESRSGAVYSALYAGVGLAAGCVGLLIVLACLGCVLERRQKGKPVDAPKAKSADEDVEYQKTAAAEATWDGGGGAAVAYPAQAPPPPACDPYLAQQQQQQPVWPPPQQLEPRRGSDGTGKQAWS